MKRSLSQSRPDSSDEDHPAQKRGKILCKKEKDTEKNKRDTVELPLASAAAETILKFMRVYENGSKGIIFAPGLGSKYQSYIREWCRKNEYSDEVKHVDLLVTQSSSKERRDAFHSKIVCSIVATPCVSLHTVSVRLNMEINPSLICHKENFIDLGPGAGVLRVKWIAYVNFP